MTAEELKNKIQFESRELSCNRVRLRASITFNAIIDYTPSITSKEEVELIKERLSEMILRRLYEDQRDDLYSALQELFWADPTNHIGLATARDKILKAAKYQEPNPKFVKC